MPLKHVPNLKPLAKGMLSFAVPKLGTVHGYDNPLGTLAAAVAIRSSCVTYACRATRTWSICRKLLLNLGRVRTTQEIETMLTVRARPNRAN